MCGCLGALILVGAIFTLWDGLWHGFGGSTQLALFVVAIGAISIYGWWVRRPRRP